MCSARTVNPSAQPDFGSYLRLENDGRGWTIASDYLISGNSADVDILIDGASFPVRFSLEADVVRAAVDQDVVDAVAAGKRLNLNFDPSGQNFSLRGAQAALDLATECVRGHGLQNVGNAGTNDYNGYDIGGRPEAEETDYGTVRGGGWSLPRIAGNFAYCAGETDDRGRHLAYRLGWDAVAGRGGRRGAARLERHSRCRWRRPSDQRLGQGWLDSALARHAGARQDPQRQFDDGGGRPRIDQHPLVGTAALITKIEECVGRKGAAARRRPAPRTHARPAKMRAARPRDGCPDDGDRLPFTGICRGRAVNYLTGATTYGEANFPTRNANGSSTRCRSSRMRSSTGRCAARASRRSSNLPAAHSGRS